MPEQPDTDVELLLAHYNVAPESFNPVVESVLAVLERLTARYGEQCRIVYWLHEA